MPFAVFSIRFANSGSPATKRGGEIKRFELFDGHERMSLTRISQDGD